MTWHLIPTMAAWAAYVAATYGAGAELHYANVLTACGRRGAGLRTTTGLERISVTCKTCLRSQPYWLPQDTSPQDTSPQDTSPQDTSPQDTSPQDTSPQAPSLIGRGLVRSHLGETTDQSHRPNHGDLGHHPSTVARRPAAHPTEAGRPSPIVRLQGVRRVRGPLRLSRRAAA